MAWNLEVTVDELGSISLLFGFRGMSHGKSIVIHLCLLKDYQHDPADGRDIEQLGGMCT
jgi:hypothetical protein